MPDPLAVGFTAAGALKILAELVWRTLELIFGLSGSGSKCDALLKSMKSLKRVLRRADDRFNQSRRRSHNNTELGRYISDCESTCTKIESRVQTLNRGSRPIRAVRWRLMQSEMNGLQKTLNCNISTL